jgi:preprotein translocase subunit SecG
MWVVALTVVHVLVCAFLIIVVLLQSGRGADVAAAFGGMGSQTAFGPRGSATVLSRATQWSAILFMITSITLSIIASRRSTSGSVLGNIKPGQSKSQPVQQQAPKPEAPPATPK